MTKFTFSKVVASNLVFLLKLTLKLTFLGNMCTLRDFVSFVQFITKINTPPRLFLTFFKLYKWYQTAQRITYFRIFRIIFSIGLFFVIFYLNSMKGIALIYIVV